MGMMKRAREMAARTPPHRNRYVDFLRAISIAVVVFGHWLTAVITVEDGDVTASHLLAEAPAFQLLTWVFQVMPIFFMVGGYSNAASWDAAVRAGKGYGNWLRSRCQRLLGPTAIFALAWVPITLLAQRLVASPEALALMGGVVTVPLWFLAVYVAVIPVAPVMLYLHRRYGLAVPMVFTLAVAVLDIIDMHVFPPHEKFDITIAWANYGLVWLAVHQIGFFWREGKLETSPRTKVWLILAGLGGLIALTASGLYPLSMIGVPGTVRTNNTPPTVVLILLAIFQMGLILASSRWARNRLENIDLWARTVIANSMIMTIYLWHMTASVLVVFVGIAFGIGFKLAPLSLGWWSMRIVWLAALSLVLFAFVALFGRFERPRPPAAVASGWRTAVVTCMGALLASAGLAALAMEGFYAPDKLWGVPVGALLMLLLGAGAVGVTPRIYMRPR
jgi:hypothetical protein